MAKKWFLSIIEGLIPFGEDILIDILTKSGILNLITSAIPPKAAKFMLSAINVPDSWGKLGKILDQALKTVGSKVGEIDKDSPSAKQTSGNFIAECGKLLKDNKDPGGQAAADAALGFLSIISRISNHTFVKKWIPKFYKTLDNLGPMGLRTFGFLAAFDINLLRQIDPANISEEAQIFSNLNYPNQGQGGPIVWVQCHSRALMLLRQMLNDQNFFNEEVPIVEEKDFQKIIQQVHQTLENTLAAQVNTLRVHNAIVAQAEEEWKQESWFVRIVVYSFVLAVFKYHWKSKRIEKRLLLARNPAPIALPQAAQQPSTKWLKRIFAKISDYFADLAR